MITSRQKWILNNPEKNQQSKADYRERNREKLRIANKQYDKDNPIKTRAKVLKRRGMTLESYEKMFNEQQGRCAICLSTDPGKKRKHLVVDHCHKTGKIRGLLCVVCNVGLGHFKDSPSLLHTAMLYLNKD